MGKNGIVQSDLHNSSLYFALYESQSISLCRYHKQILSNNKAVVGNATLLFLSSEIIDHVNSYLRLSRNSATISVTERARVFYRLEVNGQLFYSAQYSRVHKRNSYTVVYTNPSGQKRFGLIQYFILIVPGDVVLAVLKTLVPLSLTAQEHFQLTSPAIDKASKLTLVRDSGVLDVTSVDSIQKCIYISFTSSPTRYVMAFPDVLHD